MFPLPPVFRVVADRLASRLNPGPDFSIPARAGPAVEAALLRAAGLGPSPRVRGERLLRQGSPWVADSMIVSLGRLATVCQQHVVDSLVHVGHLPTEVPSHVA